MNTEEVNKNADIRKLATVATVLDLTPITWADQIEHAQIRGWKVIVKKDQLKIGDHCIYIEIGSICPDGIPEEFQDEMKDLTKKMSKQPKSPEKEIIQERMDEISNMNIRPEFEFLRRNKFLIRTRIIRGCISQGIVFPLSILENVGVDLNTFDLYEGRDVTDILGITQYIEPEPANLDGDAKGGFPFNQLKSDEERIENLVQSYPILKAHRYVVTEKLEGSSANYFLDNNEFGVCSRSNNLHESERNSFWKVAKKLNIEEKMRSYAETHGLRNFNIQGELVGEGVQSNIYNLKGQTVKFYASFDIDTQTYINYIQFIEMINEMGLETVPVIFDDFELPESPDDLLQTVDEYKTVFGNKVGKFFAEGWVFVARDPNLYETITRSNFGRLSFKVKSRTYTMGKY
jgi:RNA ligase (TIGR02306 family)